MDPYSTESELINIQNHFYQGQYDAVIDYDTSTLSPENQTAAQVLILRAKLGLGAVDEVAAEVKGATEPELAAVGALAAYELGQTEAAVGVVEKLVESSSDNPVVQVLGGIVLQRAGKSEDALSLLSKHEGNRKSPRRYAFPNLEKAPIREMVFANAVRCVPVVEAAASIVQIHLAQNRNDLALKEVTSARRWAQDSLLVNLAESWVGLRLVR